MLSTNNVLLEDYEFSFQTNDQDSGANRVSLAEDFQEILPSEPLITKVHSGNSNGGQSVSVEVYKFDSASNFISSRSNIDKIKSSWTRYYGEENLVNTEDLSKISSVDLIVQTKDNLQYLQLSQNLDEGYYLV